MSITSFIWQRKQDKKKETTLDIRQEIIKRERKELRKKLTRRVGGKPKTHDMDDEMYETIDKMLKSQDDSDIEIARTILFNCNMDNKYLDKIITEHCEIVLYGLRPFQTWHTASYYNQ